MQYSNSFKFNSAFGDALWVSASWVLAFFVLFFVQNASASEKPSEVHSISANAEQQARVSLKQAYKQATQDWEYVLANYVDEEGRTNFKALSDDIAPLENVVSFIGFASPAATPELFSSPEEVMSYHINSYNALAMFGVIEKGIPDGFTSFFSRAAFFKFRDVVIGGKVTNLYDYENDVIRPLNEPRAHFALNCMVKDCPRLPKTPFYPESLNETLEQLTHEFFNKQKHFYLDDKHERAYVSEILDFYTEDFVASGRAKDLPQYINQYIEQSIPSNYKLRFIDYDWRINAQPEQNNNTKALASSLNKAPSQTSKNPIVEAAFALHSREINTYEPEQEAASKAPFLVTSTPNQTTVLELYTSQGCSSCPPAEKWISGFVDSEKLWTELVPINFHVDYWDYLGWKDPFADSTFSQRQRDYKRVGKANTIATPGFALNGRAWNGWFRGQSLPNKTAPLTGVLHASADNDNINVTFNKINANKDNPSLTVHAALLGFGIETSVKRGENAGRKLVHDFVVIDYEQGSLSFDTQYYQGHLPFPENSQTSTTRKAIVVWVSQESDPSPLQVAASWLN
ncbi:DUF1223 domain-containing protein [Alteromonas sp. BMJM2]|uniref:DUF1223 domain-containing protein n=1 Tax=Alteromonas sp. BMJM2 TaxID=2954241 RepID=UPI0022B50B37|nr:DUF1223 domain-containing protein [Alteromonas sp. BMJM2]